MNDDDEVTLKDATEVFTAVNGLQAAADLLEEDANKLTQTCPISCAALKGSAAQYRKLAQTIEDRFNFPEGDSHED